MSEAALPVEATVSPSFRARRRRKYGANTFFISPYNQVDRYRRTISRATEAAQPPN